MRGGQKVGTHHQLRPLLELIPRYQTPIIINMYHVEGHAQEIEHLLYLGDSDASAAELSDLETRNIKNILIAGMGLMKYHPEDKINYLQIKAIDVPIFNILEHMPKCFDFIEAAHARGEAVLVHCARGKSRSFSIVAGFMMWKHRISYAEAVHRIREKRPEVDPNFGFQEQLRLFERMEFTFSGDSKAHEEYVRTWKPRNHVANAIKSTNTESQAPPAEAKPTESAV